MNEELVGQGKVAGEVAEGMPTPKEVAIFLRGVADHLESGGFKEGDDPKGDRFGKNLATAGTSPERIKELKQWPIKVDISVSQVVPNGMEELIQELESVFGPGSVIVERASGQNAPSTDTPQ